VLDRAPGGHARGWPGAQARAAATPDVPAFAGERGDHFHDDRGHDDRGGLGRRRVVGRSLSDAPSTPLAQLDSGRGGSWSQQAALSPDDDDGGEGGGEGGRGDGTDEGADNKENLDRGASARRRSMRVSDFARRRPLSRADTRLNVPLR
jgi:hypothetical protein